MRKTAAIGLSPRQRRTREVFMKKELDLTQGNVLGILIRFALPFLFASFMQAFYGAVDLYVVGRFGGAADIAAVNIGSQVMQIITSFIIGISMGVTVRLAHHIGSKDHEEAARTVGNAVILFLGIALVITPLMTWQSDDIVLLMETPAAAVARTANYVFICSIGLPFIIAYNVIAALLRGVGDSKTPMYFIGVACVVNVIADFALVGGLSMGVAGAALATVLAQTISSLCGIIYLIHHGFPFDFQKKHIKWKGKNLRRILVVGLPIAMQDTLINIAFIALTVIANFRGLIASSAVGVTEKLIMFMFLVPSAMLSAISAITAQNMGAGKRERAVLAVKYGILITAVFGAIMCAASWLIPDLLTGIFTKDPAVIEAAGEYLRTYSIDCILVAFTFCVNGYLCGQDKSIVTFIHNTISIFIVRIPVAYLLSELFADSLLPMGLASPLGSVLSILILLIYFSYVKRRGGRQRKD